MEHAARRRYLSTQMSELVFEVGIGLWGQVRDYLNLIALRCPNVRWHESRGWIVRTFTVVGPATDIQNISFDLQRWISTNKLDK